MMLKNVMIKMIIFNNVTVIIRKIMIIILASGHDNCHGNLIAISLTKTFMWW